MEVFVQPTSAELRATFARMIYRSPISVLLGIGVVINALLVAGLLPGFSATTENARLIGASFIVGWSLLFAVLPSAWAGAIAASQPGKDLLERGWRLRIQDNGMVSKTSYSEGKTDWSVYGRWRLTPNAIVIGPALGPVIIPLRSFKSEDEASRAQDILTARLGRPIRR